MGHGSIQPHPISSESTKPLSAIKEEKPGITGRTSKTQEDTQMPPASTGKEDTGGRQTEEGSPANYRLPKHTTQTTSEPLTLSRRCLLEFWRNAILPYALLVQTQSIACFVKPDPFKF
ncbi:hypothetical protein Trydic_g22616 [Trypoxylus dichotomus]